MTWLKPKAALRLISKQGVSWLEKTPFFTVSLRTVRPATGTGKSSPIATSSLAVSPPQGYEPARTP